MVMSTQCDVKLVFFARKIVLAAVLCLFTQASSAFGGAIAKDTRMSFASYGILHKLSENSVRQAYGASGRIMCPFNEASAFLIHRSDIVVTARHVIYPEKVMNSYAGRMAINRCGFEVSDGKDSVWYSVDIKSFRKSEAEQRSTTDRFDWIVMKLATPVVGFQPYRLPSKHPAIGEKIKTVSIRQDGFRPDGWHDRIIADCSIRALDAIDKKPASGLRTDCSWARGASGGALLRETENGPEALGIMSSTTSLSCERYDRTRCFSFAVGFTSEIIEAIRELAEE